MRFDLASMVRRASRRPIVIRPILTTKAQADDLAAIYFLVVNAWRDAGPEIVAVYDRTLGQKLRTDSADDLGSDISEISEAINRLVLQLTPDLRRWAVRVEQWHRGKWTNGVLSGANVSLESMLTPFEVEETVNEALQRNVALVRDISDEARGRIADSVFRGIQQRTPTAQIAKEISEATGMARARARRVAADQTVKLASALDAERQRQAGLDHWKWRSSHKLHYRPWHQARDGKIYTDATAPEDLPGTLPFCGCVRQGVIVFGDE